jgi:hypothetical protein
MRNQHHSETLEQALVRGLKIQVIPPITPDVGRCLQELEELEDTLNIDVDEDVWEWQESKRQVEAQKVIAILMRELPLIELTENTKATTPVLLKNAALPIV